MFACIKYVYLTYLTNRKHSAYNIIRGELTKRYRLNELEATCDSLFEHPATETRRRTSRDEERKAAHCKHHSLWMERRILGITATVNSLDEDDEFSGKILSNKEKKTEFERILNAPKRRKDPAQEKVL